MYRINPSDLPSPPQTALDIINACSKDDADYKQLSNLVSNDPHLTAEILRLVNSAFYARSTPVTTINQAISIIGMKNLQSLSLCLAIKNSFNESSVATEFLSDFWHDSISRALAAKFIAANLGLDEDESFTTGLLQDLGMLVMVYLQSDKVAEWNEMRVLSPEKRLVKELTAFDITHTEIMQQLGECWALPHTLIDPIVNHHCAGANEEASENYLLYEVVDWLAYVLVAKNTHEAAQLAKRHITARISISEETIDQVLEDVSQGIADAASAFGVDIDTDVSYSDLLRRSNKKLADDSLDFQQLTWRLKHTINERDRLAKELDMELLLAKEIQLSLIPLDSGMPFCGLNIPAKKLSGDFYDYYPLKDGKMMFCLADVAGKGLNASLLMVKTSSLFRCLGKYMADLSQLIRVINRELCETTIRGMFVTMVCGKYDPETGDVELINAGHPPALLLKQGEVTSYSSDNIPLGIDADVQYDLIHLNIQDGRLYMFSDGVMELQAEDNNRLGIDGIVNYIKDAENLTSKEQLDQLLSKLTQESLKTDDDLSALILDG